MGTYCSYCERRLPTSLAVEHVIPKSLDPSLQTAWKNFLLGCTNCNSVKLNRPTNNRDFLWPDVDNTMLAYSYHQGGFVKIASGLKPSQLKKAKKLMDLVGLDRHISAGNPVPAKRDKRWQQRKDAWDAAVQSRLRLTQLGDVPAAQELIIEIAVGLGFFSVWMTVYSDHQAIRQGLIQKFKGTAVDCFDATYILSNRPRGRI
ncbi:MAG TPA: HNH endonuclease [Planctomicrobium sp.]|nr:HNH endonuclease [Planctomicrobium sp.]